MRQSVETLRVQHNGVPVYNFSVADSHTYFVRAEASEAQPVWVHNECVEIGAESVEAIENRMARNQKLWRRHFLAEGEGWYNGEKPVLIDGMHNRRIASKSPLPTDAAVVFQHAVPEPVAPNSLTGRPQHWWGLNAEGDIYRFSDNGIINGQLQGHWSGSGFPRNFIPKVVRNRLGL